MKRTPGAPIAIGALLLCCVAAAGVPASSAPTIIPNLIAPQLFPGFEPIEPDAFGLSPDLRFVVISDDRGLRVIRRSSGLEVFRQRIADPVATGFDPSDRRFFLLERAGGGYRFRFIDLANGFSLRDERFQDRPEIRTNENASANTIIVRNGTRSQVLLFNRAGREVYRRGAGANADVGFQFSAPSAAIVDRDAFGRAEIIVVNVATGRLTVHQTLFGDFQAGFETDDGAAFLIAAATSEGSFRVRLVNARNGRPLVNRRFQGPVRAGFLPEGGVLGVVDRTFERERVFLFRTSNGEEIVAGREKNRRGG